MARPSESWGTTEDSHDPLMPAGGEAGGLGLVGKASEASAERAVTQRKPVHVVDASGGSGSGKQEQGLPGAPSGSTEHSSATPQVPAMHSSGAEQSSVRGLLLPCSLVLILL